VVPLYARIARILLDAVVVFSIYATGFPPPLAARVLELALPTLE
jgi:hypothetical protein